MSVWIDLKYLKLISYRLDGWVEKRISPHQSLCRCNICGDSQKKINKKRGYFYEKGTGIFYRCFNCEASMSLGKFMKDFDPFVYKQYALESYKERTGYVEKEELQPKDFIPKKREVVKPSILTDLIPMKDLSRSDPARIYYDARKIPEQHIGNFYYAENFFKWASTNTDKFSDGAEINLKDHPRIIIPWYNESREIFAYQARSIQGQEPKYYTIILDDSTKKLFGVERLDRKKKIYVCEGPLDSLFIPNCVAVGSSALLTFDDAGLDVTYVFDNEKRNPDIVKLIATAVISRKNVFIPPMGYQHKDINDAILSGISPEELKDIIDQNTWSGAFAVFKFNLWKRS